MRKDVFVCDNCKDLTFDHSDLKPLMVLEPEIDNVNKEKFAEVVFEYLQTHSRGIKVTKNEYCSKCYKLIKNRMIKMLQILAEPIPKAKKSLRELRNTTYTDIPGSGKLSKKGDENNTDLPF